MTSRTQWVSLRQYFGTIHIPLIHGRLCWDAVARHHVQGDRAESPVRCPVSIFVPACLLITVLSRWTQKISAALATATVVLLASRLRLCLVLTHTPVNHFPLPTFHVVSLGPRTLHPAPGAAAMSRCIVTPCATSTMNLRPLSCPFSLPEVRTTLPADVQRVAPPVLRRSVR